MEAVRGAYAILGAPPVAVRSSATAEDLPAASFAGQMETYLNVRGETALLDAVRRCWASLWTARAISYRANQGIPPAAVSLAVVVQELIEADAAGVLFTANPVNGRRDQMVIDGTWGLGEALVSGQVSPDHWILNVRTGAVVEARVSRKEVMTTRQEAGTVTLPVPADLQNKPVLNDAQSAALVELGRRVESHYGAPQDVEWALAQGRFYLVQARPITSLFPLLPSAASDGERVYVCANTLQGLVAPFTPAGISAFRNLSRGMARLFGYNVRRGEGAPAFAVAGGCVYVDITAALKNPTARKLLLRATGGLDRQISAILHFLVERDPQLTAPPGRFPLRPSPGFLLRKLGQAIYAVCRLDAARMRALARVDAFVTALERRADSTHGLAERQRFLEDILPTIVPSVATSLLPLVAPAGLAVLRLHAHFQAWLGDTGELQPVLRALPHNPTTEMDLALWDVAQQLKQEGVESSAEHPAIQGFLARYGHRAACEIDLGVPRWRDDPTPILNILRTYLTHGEELDPAVHFRRGTEQADEAAANLIARVRQTKGSLHATWVGFLLRRVRALAGLREYPKFYAVRMLAAARRVIAGAGVESVTAARLDRADDVFFLDLRDWQSSHDLRARAAANRAEYDREQHRRSIPRVLTSTGEAFTTAPVTTPGALVGTAASAGVYEGSVRVVFDPREAELEPGEILVAPGTDPAWTPLFLTAGALVMEIGGIMSHGSVVAREYGIPAVVGVAAVTQQLHTGQRVRVDGENGLVVPM